MSSSPLTQPLRADVSSLPQPCETQLAKDWFVNSLLTAGLSAQDRRAQYGVGGINAPERRSAFAQQFAPQVRPGVQLSEVRAEIDHVAVELGDGRFALSPQFQR
ncbi:MAG: hypothetical protein JWN72_1733 [Thermoleophilia bacterium]|nr:hypothetical protein [Thermoleophilia bacterium]